MMVKENDATGLLARKTGETYGTLLGSTVALQESNVRFTMGMMDAYMGMFFAPLSFTRERLMDTPPDSVEDDGGDLPLENYDELTVEDVSERLEDLGALEVRAVRSYERRHKNRGELLERLDRSLV